MAAPAPSKLDFEQIIQGSYDEATGRLRVDTELATVDIGGQQEILITDDVDAIKIGDGNHQYLAINPDGSINVNVSASSGVVSNNFFNSITSVPSGVPTTLLTFTTPASGTFYLQRIEVSGTNIAQYDIYINSLLSGRQRTYFGSSLNSSFDFSDGGKGLLVSASTLIEIECSHLRPNLGDFEARMQYGLG